MNPSTDKDREVWGRYLAAYREAHPNAGIPGACLTIDALRVFERNARSSCAASEAWVEAVECCATFMRGAMRHDQDRLAHILNGFAEIRAMKGTPLPESETIKEGK